jgi:RNA polymerase sigma-70 factor, ECF subfamily
VAAAADLTRKESGPTPRILRFESNLGTVCHKFRSSGVVSIMSTRTEAIADMNTHDASFNLEMAFRAHYDRVTLIIGRVVGDRGRAQELAVEVFLKLWRNREAQGEQMKGWLYRTAVHKGLDELRRRNRRARHEGLLNVFLARSSPATPEEIHIANEEQEKVRSVLTLIEPRQAELLMLRSNGFSYEEVASIVRLNPTSVGTLLSRAQQAFRKEYIKKYGQE